MNTEILKQALESIGWSLRHCGCDEYIIVNNIGKETEIEVSTDRIRIMTRKVFGDTKSINYPKYQSFGTICFFYSHCEIKVHEDHVSLVGKNCGGCFITFRKIKVL
jgi:hypothetical protein